MSRDQTLSIVNVETYEKLKVLPLFEPIESAVFASGSLFTVGEEGVLKCWNPENAKLLRSADIYRSAYFLFCEIVFFFFFLFVENVLCKKRLMV